MARRFAVLVSALALGAAGSIAACVDERLPLGPKNLEPIDAATPPPSDGGIDATILSRFTTNVEGLTIHPDGGAVLVGQVNGRIVRVEADGGQTTYAEFAGMTQAALLGLASDGAGNTYAAVAQFGASPVPSPGIYRIPPGGGAPVAFSVPTAPAMVLPNGIDLVGSDLYVTDSFAGRIFKVDSAGTATVWAEGPTLGHTDAGAPFGAFFGVNGITHDDKAIYVTNLEQGLFLGFQRSADASVPTANVPTLTFQNFFLLVGADGVIREANDTFLVANNPQDRIVRLVIERSGPGRETVLPFVAYEGRGFDRPASVAIRGKELLFTNAAFRGANEDAAPPQPSLASVPLP